MSHFAQIDSDNNVVAVIVAEQNFIDSGAVGEPSAWIQTSYNTVAGVHTLGGVPLRKNFAAVGFTYNPTLDAFIPPKLFESWVLNEETCLWESPVAYPADGNEYSWNESTTSWDLVPSAE
jgi:hypothetical protein